MYDIMPDSTTTACRQPRHTRVHRGQPRHTRVHRAGSRQAAIKCPSWCEVDHDIDPDGSHNGPSWPEVPSISIEPGVNCSVTVSAGMDTDGSPLMALDATGSLLTAEQAREVGLALLSAASWAKDQVSA